MALDSMQKRMSAIAPASPWRGPMVDATESSFNAGNRAAAAFMYSGLIDGGGGPPAITGTAAITLAAVTVSASGTQLLAITGTGAVTLPSIAVSASGTQLLAITGTSDIILPSVTVSGSGTAGDTDQPSAIRGGDDAYLRRLVRKHRKRLREQERAEEEFRERVRERDRSLERELQAIYERVVEGVEPAAVAAATAAVAPFMASRQPEAASPTLVEWDRLITDTEAVISLLRAFGAMDIANRRERIRRRNNAMAALLLDG